MADFVFQVCYRGPARYEASASDIAKMSHTVEAFLQEECGKKSGVIGITVGALTGLFTVYTRDAASASGLPFTYGEFERNLTSVKLPLARVNQASRLYRAASGQ